MSGREGGTGGPGRATDLARAVRAAGSFVRGQGDALLSPWASVLAGDERADAGAAAEALVGAQRADGGFGGLPGTRRVLALLDDLGARGGPVQERACAWLLRSQAADGHWGEGDAAVFETGVLAGLLARAPWVPGSALEAASGWLAQRFTPDAVQGFRWAPLAGYAAAFANLRHESSDGILQWCGRELERGFRTGAFDAVRSARVLLWCDAPSLPGGRLSGDELLHALLEQQELDGGWPAPAGRRAARAWDGLLGLCRFGAAHLAESV